MTEKTKAIKHLMIDANVNQTGIAKHFSWTPGYVSRLIRGGELGPAGETNMTLVINFLESQVKEGV